MQGQIVHFLTFGGVSQFSGKEGRTLLDEQYDIMPEDAMPSLWRV